jgi:hypothetical protein
MTTLRSSINDINRITVECKLNDWVPRGAKVFRLVYPTMLSSTRTVATAP